MGILGFFKAAPKAIDNVLDKDNGLLSQFGGWVNDQQLTEAERLKTNTKTVSSVQAFVVATLSESTERSKARREIAFLWIKTQLALVLLCAIAAPWNMELAEFYFKLGTSALMALGTTAIIVFFFGSHGLARYNETKK
jgi:hypothetical protein